MRNRLSLLLAFGFLSAVVSFGQTSTGSITGIISDPSGGVIAGAKVVATNSDTGRPYAVTSNEAGVYNVASLQAGTYKLEVGMTGFESVAVSGLKLDPGQVIKNNVSLSLGTVVQTVKVEAASTLVNTSGGETGGTIAAEQIQRIDVNGRNYQALASLIPGMNNINAGQQLSGLGLFNGIVVSSNGLQTDKNLFTVDGAFNMNVGNEAEPAVNPEMDVIQEVSIVASNYSAKYGYSAGAQIMVETKSGGKAFHGGAHEYLRNDAFDARNFFVKNVSPLKQNIFGYEIGGPLFIPNRFNTSKEKTFFFWGQNWRILRQGLSALGATPTQAMRGGDFSAEAARLGKPIIDPVTKLPFLNNQIPVGRFDPNAVLFLNQEFPLPNNPSGGFNNFLNDAPNKTHQTQEIARIDHNFSERFRVMARYIQEDTYNDKPFGVFAPSIFPSASSEIQTLGKSAYLRLTWVPNPYIVNNASYAFSETDVNGFPLGNASILPSQSTYQPVLANQNLRNRIPELTFSGGWTTAGIATTDSFTDAQDKTHTYSDDLTIVHGRHIFQTGIFLNYAVAGQELGTFPQGNFSFSGASTNDPIADFLLGYAATYSQNTKSRRGGLRYFQVEPYFQDDWKVTNRLTLNLGLRWAYLPPWYLQQAVTSFYPQLFNPNAAPTVSNSGVLTLTPNYSSTNGLAFSGEASLNVPMGFAQTPLATWMPRFGFAWDVFGDGKTSVRGGAGITYYRNEDQIFSTLNNPPISSTISLINANLTSPGIGTPGALLPRSLTSIPYDMVSTRIASYSLTVQREIGFDTVLSVGYSGNSGIHYPFSRDLNQTLPTGGFDFDPRLNANTINVNAIRPYLGYGSISTILSDGTENYNSLQVGLVHRYSRNLSFQAAYTYGKILGRGKNVDANRQDAYNPRADYGIGKIDRTHIFNIGYVYDFPFFRGRTGVVGNALGGWGISGLTQLDSGFALTPTLATGNRGLAARPNATGQALFGSGTQIVTQWFNKAAFAPPPAGFFGNAANGTIRGPGLVDFDFSFTKHTRLYKERVNSEFRAEFYNIFNHTNLLGVSTAFGSGTYGRVTSALDPRIMEFGFKIIF